MPYIQVLKDLSKVETKLASNLTKRQPICFSGATAMGAPAYSLTRSVIDNTPAMFLMVGLTLPFFLFTMFKRNGLPFEKILRDFIRARFLWPQVRPYKTGNFYAAWSGPGTSGQSGPRQEGTPKGGTRVAERKNGKTARTETGRR